MVNSNTNITNEIHAKIPRKHSKKTRRISETKERRSSYTFGFKRCALRHLAMTDNKSLTGRNLGIDRRLLIDWEERYKSLQQLTKMLLLQQLELL